MYDEGCCASRRTIAKWTEYGLDVPEFKKEEPLRVVDNKAKILWELQIQADKQLITNQPDIVIIDKQQEQQWW